MSIETFLARKGLPAVLFQALELLAVSILTLLHMKTAPIPGFQQLLTERTSVPEHLSTLLHDYVSYDLFHRFGVEEERVTFVSSALLMTAKSSDCVINQTAVRPRTANRGSPLCGMSAPHVVQDSRTATEPLSAGRNWTDLAFSERVSSWFSFGNHRFSWSFATSFNDEIRVFRRRDFQRSSFGFDAFIRFLFLRFGERSEGPVCESEVVALRALGENSA